MNSKTVQCTTSLHGSDSYSHNNYVYKINVVVLYTELLITPTLLFAVLLSLHS